MEGFNLYYQDISSSNINIFNLTDKYGQKLLQFVNDFRAHLDTTPNEQFYQIGNIIDVVREFIEKLQNTEFSQRFPIYSHFSPSLEQASVVAIDKDNNNNLWVAHKNNWIEKYSLERKLLLRINTGTELEGAISDIAIDNEGKIWVVEGRRHRIKIFDESGKLTAKYGRRGFSGEEEFNHPTDIAIDEDRDVVYITDSYNHRIQKFNLKGEFLGTLPINGMPYGIDINKNGNLWITDVESSKIYKLSPDGKILFHYDIYAGDDSYIPKRIILDKEENVYISIGFLDGRDFYIQKFSPEGRYIYKFGEVEFKSTSYYTYRINSMILIEDSKIYIGVEKSGLISITSFIEP